MVTLYVFDITGEFLFEVEENSYVPAVTAIFKRLRIPLCNVRGVEFISGEKNQVCVHKTYFISDCRDFQINYWDEKNHNPLRYNRVFTNRMAADTKGVLHDVDVMPDGTVVKKDLFYKATEINQCFMKPYCMLYNPYYLEYSD